jgi:class 3 adenylate cyclase
MLFMDIRGFTAYSEKTPPEVVVRYLNRILSIHSDVHQ